MYDIVVQLMHNIFLDICISLSRNSCFSFCLTIPPYSFVDHNKLYLLNYTINIRIYVCVSYELYLKIVVLPMLLFYAGTISVGEVIHKESAQHKFVHCALALTQKTVKQTLCACLCNQTIYLLVQPTI